MFRIRVNTNYSEIFTNWTTGWCCQLSNKPKSDNEKIFVNNKQIFKNIDYTFIDHPTGKIVVFNNQMSVQDIVEIKYKI